MTLPIRAPEDCPEGTLDPRWLQADIDANIARGLLSLGALKHKPRNMHGMSYDEAQTAIKHLEEVEGGGYACPIVCCAGRTFANRGALVRHLQVRKEQ